MKTFRYKLITFSFMIPALVLFTIVMVVPFVQGTVIALTNWNGSSTEMNFVGLRNLVMLFTIDPNSLSTIGNTLKFTVMSAVTVNVLGLLVAIGMNGKFKGKEFLRMLMFAPIAASMVIAAFTFTYVFNLILPKVLNMEKGLLGSRSTVMYGITLICVWRDTGLAMVIYYAALKNVPLDLIEAATIDGANAVARFFRITLPLIAPAITTNVSLWLGWGLKVFEYPYIATQGGPGTSSRTFAIFVYEHAFVANRVGYAQMAAFVMLFIIVICTGSVNALLRRREVEH